MQKKKKNDAVNNLKNEKRKAGRIQFEAEVILRSDNSEIIATTKSLNISPSGIYIQSAAKAPVGSSCFIEILLMGKTSRLSFNIKGHVVRHDADGMGIEFADIELDSYYHLNNILQHNVLDPATIKNEIFSST